ncbi:hypothetical protein [Taklimakanibacter deserti]|uniref:hypothetical protein n=1 Tax=Taklimakanibacter deserti TaxID=2267839 RepID=UPI0013C4F8EE
MDNDLLIHHLSIARRHVEQGRRHIAKQEEIIAKLEAHGLDSSNARNLLALFEDTLKLHIAHCARLEDALKAMEAPQQWHQSEAARPEASIPLASKRLPRAVIAG